VSGDVQRFLATAKADQEQRRYRDSTGDALRLIGVIGVIAFIATFGWHGVFLLAILVPWRWFS
jgi:hypothetical protein